jgi:hypothetical protein
VAELKMIGQKREHILTADIFLKVKKLLRRAPFPFFRTLNIMALGKKQRSYRKKVHDSDDDTTTETTSIQGKVATEDVR